MMAGSITPNELRDEIAEVLWARVSANELDAVCDTLGFAPQPDGGDDPMASKRKYVRSRLWDRRTLGDLAEMARRVDEEFGDERLRAALARMGPHGVEGELRNLIFAANGPKPRIVLRDAINNIIDIVENAEYCLVYDRPLATAGLSWRELTAWWAETHGDRGDELTNARALYARLAESLGSAPERRLFETYCKHYGPARSFELPALIPQVYLHYDPYTRAEVAARAGEELPRQRMDFLLLFPDRVRVVIEVDGKQHYSTDDGAEPRLYAQMMAEDRRLRLSGYEIYRFGAQELTGAGAEAVVSGFFGALLGRHGSEAETESHGDSEELADLIGAVLGDPSSPRR
jgi:hypothetical protein